MVEGEAVEREVGEGVVWEGAWGDAEDKRGWIEQDEGVNWEFDCEHRWGGFEPRGKFVREWWCEDERKYGCEATGLMDESIGVLRVKMKLIRFYDGD